MICDKCKSEIPMRSIPQNSLYRRILRMLEDVTGNTADELDYIFKWECKESNLERFWLENQIVTKFKEKNIFIRSTSKLNKGQFSEYIKAIAKYIMQFFDLNDYTKNELLNIIGG